MGQGNIHVRSRVDRRYRCTSCGHPFTATTNTPFYRLRHAADLVTLVVTLFAHGCPIGAIVAAFGMDKRTVRSRLHRAGQHGAALHTHLVHSVGVGQVQADEIRAQVRGGAAWIALALAVPSRLWRADMVAARRDGALIRLLLFRVRACTALDAIKSQHGRRLVEIVRRVVVGTEEAVAQALARTGGTTINTAYIDRFNALLRAQCAPLVRRRTPARGTALLQNGMWLVGCAYNWCWLHYSLRLRAVGTGHR